MGFEPTTVLKTRFPVLSWVGYPSSRTAASQPPSHIWCEWESLQHGVGGDVGERAPIQFTYEPYYNFQSSIFFFPIDNIQDLLIVNNPTNGVEIRRQISSLLKFIYHLFNPTNRNRQIFLSEHIALSPWNSLCKFQKLPRFSYEPSWHSIFGNNLYWNMPTIKKNLTFRPTTTR
jgi:hypothetical protein